MAKIIDGKAISAAVKEQVRVETEQLKDKGISVGLAVVIVGNNPASRVYVNNKKKTSYKVVIYGDVNGDGEINVLDMIKVNRHILGLDKLSGTYLVAADANHKGDGLNVLDMIYINRHALGLSTIKQ